MEKEELNKIVNKLRKEIKKTSKEIEELKKYTIKKINDIENEVRENQVINRKQHSFIIDLIGKKAKNM